MNRLILSFILLVVLVVVSADDEARSKAPNYPTKYDNIDLESILSNFRILRNYIDCCVDKKPCDAQGLELKAHIRDALENNCDKCSEVQRKAVKKVCKKVYTEKPEWWKELCDHFDPEGKYQEKYQKFIEDTLAEKDD
ncbi:hypothetical protein JTB14_007407 [Gonioctena quinquepunctata]|nr:hypothetical protein JTB14_007407 [Gonioctena quinquepunctata]